MSRAPKQSTVEGERLRRAQADARREAQQLVSDRLPHGAVVLFVDDAVVPDGWHRCNGQMLLRSRYPRLASVLTDTGNDAEFEVPAAVAPAGFDFWIWGPD